MIKITGIYKIRNKSTNLFYLGSSNNINYRWDIHKSLLRNNRHFNSHLQNAWNKYGEEDFEFLIIEEIKDESLLLNIEDQWLEKTNCYERELGYNIRKIASRIDHTEETKEKIKQSKIGQKASQEAKRKISKSLLGNTRTLGHVLTEEHKQEISSSLTRFYQENEVSQETREKLRIANTGKKASVETKEKLRTAHVGKPSGRVVYTKDQIAEFKKEIEQGATQSEVARKYKIAASTMSYILHKRL